MRTIRSKITLTYIAVALFTISLTGWMTYRQVQHDQFTTLVNELDSQINTVQSLIRLSARDGVSRIQVEELLHEVARTSGVRVTLVDEVGRVLFESQLTAEEARALENHLARPEVAAAQSNGRGVATRYSVTLQLPMAYVARRIQESPADERFPRLRYIRVARSMSEVDAATRRLRLGILASAILTLVVVTILSVYVSRRISKPVERMATLIGEVKSGNYLASVDVRSNDEIGRLGRLLNEMVAHLHADAVQLEKLQAVRTQFLANVSHELRTPLFSLKGFLETLLDGGLGDPAINRRFIEKSYAQANRLDQLLSDLIDISKIESGELKPSLRFFSVRPFIEHVVQESMDLAARREQTISAVLPPPNVSVLGDKALLRQVLTNLIDNALKYSPKGAVVIVAAEEISGGVLISVRDNGPGIAEEHQARIFERFYRVDANRSRQLGGTGLGLAIVKHIVEAHSSRINVHSELGKGTVFSFSLPTSSEESVPGTNG